MARAGTRVVGVTRGTSTGANTNDEPTDVHYPIQLKRLENLTPNLSIVDEEPATATEEGETGETHIGDVGHVVEVSTC